MSQPIMFPTKIVALAYNYKGMEPSVGSDPLIFIKPRTSIIPEGFAIKIPEGDVWVEVELAFSLRMTACNVSVEDAAEYIGNFCVANDVTMRGIHSRDWHLPRSKGLDTYCPLSIMIETSPDTDDLEMRTFINGELCQVGNTGDRIMNDCEAISYISRLITLEAGDIVLTGTPAGVENTRIKPGDIVTMEIDKIGVLTNPVVRKT